MYVPNPACPNCHGDFVELVSFNLAFRTPNDCLRPFLTLSISQQIEEENDPRSFIATEANTDDEDDEDSQNPSLPALILSILQSVHRTEDMETALDIDDSSEPDTDERGFNDSVLSSPNSRLSSPNLQNTGAERLGRDGRNGSSLRQLLADIFSSQFSNNQNASETSNSRGPPNEPGIQVNGRNLDRMDGLYSASYSRTYVSPDQLSSENIASRPNGHSPSPDLNSLEGSDATNPRQSFFRQLFTTLASGSDIDSDESTPFTITSRDGRYSLTAR